MAAENQNPVFNNISLIEDGGKHPLSLPLVLPSNYTFDFPTQKLTEKSSIHHEEMAELKLVPEFVRLLEKISKPVAVVSINGPYRSGKSYFLSRMLGNYETFKLGHTTDACTRGIWMATSVLDCDEFALVLLDTEGIDATGKGNESGATKLLVLSMLLSSMFIYNSRKVPKLKDLKKMSYLASISSMMEGSQSSTSVLPSFLWLLRDADSIPEKGSDGQSLSYTSFLHQILQKNKSCIASSTLLQYFPSLKCLGIPPPSTDSVILADITSHTESLSPCFSEGLSVVIDYVLSNVNIKRGFEAGMPCNGSMLSSLIEQYFYIASEARDKVPTFKRY